MLVGRAELVSLLARLAEGGCQFAGEGEVAVEFGLKSHGVLQNGPAAGWVLVTSERRQGPGESGYR